MGIVLIIGVPFGLVGLYALWQNWRWGGESDKVFAAVLVLGGLLAVIFFVLGVNRLEENGKIQEFLAIKATVEAARQNEDVSELELAALQQKVVEANKWLASAQYYRKLFWTSIFYPPSVLELEPLR